MRTGWIGDLEVSVIGLGCNNFGRALDKEQSAAVVDAALDAGITHFDTASNYGEAQSEAFLEPPSEDERRRCDRHQSRRPHPRLGGQRRSSAGLCPQGPGSEPHRARHRLRRHLHGPFPDPETPIEDTLAVMSDMVDEGKVRQIGCSNFDPAQLNEALAVSAEHGWPPFVCDQVQYSMIHREPEASGLADLCVEAGVALLPYYPLANGLLTGKTRRGGEPQGRLKMDRYQDFLTDENFDLVEGVERFASERGVTMVQVASGMAAGPGRCARGGSRSYQSGAGRGNAKAAEWDPSTEDLEELAQVVDP